MTITITQDIKNILIMLIPNFYIMSRNLNLISKMIGKKSKIFLKYRSPLRGNKIKSENGKQKYTKGSKNSQTEVIEIFN